MSDHLTRTFESHPVGSVGLQFYHKISNSKKLKAALNGIQTMTLSKFRDTDSQQNMYKMADMIRNRQTGMQTDRKSEKMSWRQTERQTERERETEMGRDRRREASTKRLEESINYKSIFQCLYYLNFSIIT